MILFISGAITGCFLAFIFREGEVNALRKELMIKFIEHDKTRAELNLSRREYRQLSIGLYKAMKEGGL